jgi:hypothetical protein
MVERPEKKLLELEREQWRRECRRNLVAFAVEALAPLGQKPAKHHRFICEYLMQLVRSDLHAAGRTLRQLMIMAPPGSSKTTYVSRLFVTWYLAAFPGAKVIAVSHIATLAETNSGYVQRYIRDNAAVLGYSLANDDKSHWYTDDGGEYLAVGVGGTVRGFRADLIVIDDLIRPLRSLCVVVRRCPPLVGNIRFL